MMHALAFTVALLTLTPSASTLAAVAVFAANAERKWPADEREPFVTAEALRLLEAAGRAIAGDWKLDTGQVHDSIASLAATRSSLETLAADAEDRPRLVRDALVSGGKMIKALTAALHREDASTKSRLSELKRSADSFDRKRSVRQQGIVIEQYFRQAAAVLRGLLDAPSAAGKSRS